MAADEPGSGGSGPSGPWQTAFALAGIGTMNAASLLGGAALGWLVDRHFGTTPGFLFLGALAGIVLGVAGTYQKIRRYLDG